MRWVLARLAVSILPALLSARILNAESIHPVVIVYLTGGCLVPLIRPRSPRLCRALLVIWTTAGAFVVSTAILITPYSAYRIWFDLVQSGAMRGSISDTFVLLIGYLSALTALGIRAGAGAKPFLHLGVLYGTTAHLVLGSWEPAAMAAVCALCAVVVHTTGRGGATGRHPYRLAHGIAVVLAAVFLIGTVTVPTVPSAKRSEPSGVRLFDHFLSEALRSAVLRVFPRFPLLYGVAGYGHGFSVERIGAAPVLSERALFAVDAAPGTVLYLRTRVYDSFDGAGWHQSASAAQSQPGQRVSTGFEEEAAAPAPTPAPAERIISGVYRPVLPAGSVVEVTVLADYYADIPHTLDTRFIERRSLGPSARSEWVPVTATPEAGRLPTDPLLHGEVVRLHRLPRPSWAAPDVSAPAAGVFDPGVFDPGIFDPDAPVPTAPDVNELTRGRYTAVPATITPQAVAVAAQLDTSSSTAFRAGLTSLFNEEFAYSLEPRARGQAGGPGTPQPDVVSDFLLRDRTGYCVHFATAAAVLARLRDIPARYVTGFVVQLPWPDGSDTGQVFLGPARSEISGLHSHAWVELWFADTGWVTFEATPPFRALLGEQRWTGPIGADSLTRRQVHTVIGLNTDAPDSGQQSGAAHRNERTTGDALRHTLYVVAAFTAAVALTLMPRVVARAHHFLRARTNPEFAFQRQARRAVRAATKLAIPPPAQTGWLAWERAVHEHMQHQHGSNSDRGQAIEQLQSSVFRQVLFGSLGPTAADAECAAWITDKLGRTRRGRQSTACNHNGNAAH